VETADQVSNRSSLRQAPPPPPARPSNLSTSTSSASNISSKRPPPIPNSKSRDHPSTRSPSPLGSMSSLHESIMKLAERQSLGRSESRQSDSNSDSSNPPSPAAERINSSFESLRN
jgi:serine/threonine-protein kinase MRCK